MAAGDGQAFPTTESSTEGFTVDEVISKWTVLQNAPCCNLGLLVQNDCSLNSLLLFPYFSYV